MLGKIRSGLKGTKSAIAEIWNRTLVGMAFRTTTKEEWESVYENAVERAKKLSDFVGLLLRAAFAYICYKFFINAAGDAGGILSRTALGICASLSFVAYFLIFLNFLRVVAVSFMSDARFHDNVLVKIAFLCSSIFITISVAYGIMYLVNALATASKLLS